MGNSENYKWTDNPTEANVSVCDPDILNECLMYLRNESVSKMYETGAVSDDLKGFEELLKRAHSSFDKSKFEVVGSPTITNDGIASGFSDSNYITKENVFSLNENGDFHIDFKFDSEIYSSIQYFIDIYNSINDEIIIRRESNSNIYTCICFVDGSSVFNEQLNSQGHNSIEGYIEYKNGTYTFKLNDSLVTRQAAKMNALTYKISMGARVASGSIVQPLINGSIDLKSIAIWAGGIPVFNGNKTGIDVIKSDNYEIVGSPTITEDGIASGFSSSDYIKKTISLQGNYTIKGSFTINKVNSVNIPFAMSTNNQLLVSFRVDSSNSRMVLVTKNTSGSSTTKFSPVSSIKTGDKIDFIISVNGSDLELNSNKFNLEVTDFDNQETDYITFGVDRNFTYPFSGAIDLNSYRIYNPDNLIYQPCLKIPYTLSKTGSKIVDVYARSRVQDLAEQKGEALYYTIDEQNQNFTLPSADIYGMITKNRDIAEHADLATQTAYIIKCNVTGTTGYVIYSNGLCEQWGDAAIITGASVTINLPVPYKNVQFNVQTTDGGDATGSYRNSYGFYNPSGAQTIIYGVKVGNAFAWRTIGMVNLDEVLTND